MAELRCEDFGTLGMCHHSSVCPDWDREAARSRAKRASAFREIEWGSAKSRTAIEMPIPELVVWDRARIDLLSTVCFM